MGSWCKAAGREERNVMTWAVSEPTSLPVMPFLPCEAIQVFNRSSRIVFAGSGVLSTIFGLSFLVWNARMMYEWDANSES